MLLYSPTIGYVRKLTVMAAAISLSAQTVLAKQPTPPPFEEEEAKFEAPEAETVSEGNTTTWLLIGGAAVLGLGAVALGSSGGGGGDSSPESNEVSSLPEPDESEDEDRDKEEESSSDSHDSGDEEEEEAAVYTGPVLSGGGWSGYVNLVNSGNTNTPISASVSQDGGSITISTSSPYSYARVFSGKISNGGYIKVKDHSTGETWTTLHGSASANHFVLYDYVNDFTDLDKLEVSR